MSIVWNERIHVCYLLISLILYEHVITIDREFNVIWRRKYTKGTIIYLLNRYALLCFGILLALQAYRLSGNSCALLERLCEAALMVLCLMTCVFSSLRASLVWNRSRWIFVLVFSLLFVPFVTYVVRFTGAIRTSTYMNTAKGIYLCRGPTFASPAVAQTINLLDRMSVIIGDVVVVVLTWIKTLESYRQLRRLPGATVTVHLMLDGTMYFLVILSLNILTLIVNETGLLTAVTLVLSSILISRFILDLRSINQEVQHDSHSGAASAMRFADLGND